MVKHTQAICRFECLFCGVFHLTLSRRRPLSYRNQWSGANQWTGFYMITASVLKGLKRRLWHRCFFAKFLRTPISHRTPPVVVSERITTNKSNFGRQEYLRFHIWFIMTLYYNKMRQWLLQLAAAILLQNSAKIYYKMCQVLLCKM